MFIELAESLRCPAPHREQYCVLVPEDAVERDVRRGTVGCPVCRAEYPVRDGVVWFGEEPARRADAVGGAAPDADTLRAVLALDAPGGYVVLVGSAGARGHPLAAAAEVHGVWVNPEPPVASSPAVSVLRAPRGIPLRSSVARGVVLGSEFASGEWVREAVRVLRPAHRLVVVGKVDAVTGVRELAREAGLWVGERAAQSHSV